MKKTIKDTHHSAGRMRQRFTTGNRCRGWILLETVIATGVLVMGLAVLGAQVQGSDTAVRKMRLRVRAMMLAESKLAELDMGLVELDSVDRIQEEEFGSRSPEFAWRLTTEETAIDEMVVLALDILHQPSDVFRFGDYVEGDFDFDEAELIHTVYAVRPIPQPLNLSEDFGLDDEELIELNEQLAQLGIPGLDAEALDPAILAKLDFEEFLKVLPLLADVLGIDVTKALGSLPPGILDALQGSGVSDDSAGDGAGESGQPNEGS